MPNTNNNDSVTQFVSRLIDSCKAHKNALIIVLAVIVAAAAGTGLYVTQKEKTLQNSWAMFYNAQITLLNQGQQQGFAAVDALETAYPRTDAAAYGRLMQADLLYSEENYAQAQDIYQKLLSSRNKHVRAIAALSLGQTQQALKEYDKSVRTLQDFIAHNPASFALPQAYFTLAISQELSGDKAAALETYKKILEDYTKSYFGIFAKNKINQLNK